MQRIETAWESARAVQRAGDDGITLEAFSKLFWPGAGKASHRTAARMLRELVAWGYADQWGMREKARYTLTLAGEAFLRDHGPRGARRAAEAPAEPDGDEVPLWLA